MTSLRVCHLYPDLLNLYGDFGNILALRNRARFHGYDMTYTTHTIGDRLDPESADLFFIGGGQDQDQKRVLRDMLEKRELIRQAVEEGIPFLCICGGYQLMGEEFKTTSGDHLTCLHIIDAITTGGRERMIGDTVYRAEWLGEGDDQILYGFENHSGETVLGPDAVPLAQVVRGYGNNRRDKNEGCRYKNLIGTYSHGSFLPKNPAMTDWLIEKALGTELPYRGVLRPAERAARELAAKRLNP